jgi:hypothetical protein
MAVRPLTPDPSPAGGRGERCRRRRRGRAARGFQAVFFRINRHSARPAQPRTAKGHPSPLAGEGPEVRGRSSLHSFVILMPSAWHGRRLYAESVKLQSPGFDGVSPDTESYPGYASQKTNLP